MPSCRLCQYLFPSIGEGAIFDTEQFIGAYPWPTVGAHLPFKGPQRSLSEEQSGRTGEEAFAFGLGAFGLGFRLEGLGLEVWGLGCGVWGLGLGV